WTTACRMSASMSSSCSSDADPAPSGRHSSMCMTAFMTTSRMDDCDEVPSAALTGASEARRAGQHVAEAVPRSQLEARAFDLEIERTLEHPEMMFESGDRRCVEGHRCAGRHVDFDELRAKTRRRRRDRAAAIAALRILP